MNIQQEIDRLSAQWRKERAASQMTLGGLIDRLKELPPDLEVDFVSGPHSYRGYYTDLAFEPESGTMKVSELLSVAEDSLGETFIGYKGGEYVMAKDTPVWISYHGESGGHKLISISDEGVMEKKEDDI